MSAFRGSLVNTFSWSLSRRQMFEECRRQYFLNYYRSWGGWADDGSPGARLAYRLKQIVSLDMWVGDILHRLIQSELLNIKHGSRPHAVPLKERARNLLNTEWQQSIEQRWRANAKHNRNLFEHYYGMEIGKERRAGLREKLFTCIDHFCALPLIPRLLNVTADCWLAVEELDTFVVDRVPVFVKIDCAARLDGAIRIIDWKSGKRSDRDVEQTLCYGLYAMQKWSVRVEQLGTNLVYLLANETTEQAVTAAAALQMQERIVSSIAEMRAALVDAPANVAREEEYPMTENRRLCRRCNFHEICHGAGPIVADGEF